MNECFAKVYILDVPYQIDIEYTYFIPTELDGRVSPGRFVTVPFGNGNKKMRAVVYSLGGEAPKRGAKPILSVADDKFTLDEKTLGLCVFLKHYTLCTFGEALHAVMPAGAFAKLEEYYLISSKTPSGKQLDEDCRELLKYIKLVERVKIDDVTERFGEKAKKLLSKLENDGFICSDHEIVGQTNNKYHEKFFCAADDERYASLVGENYKKPELRSQKHIELLKIIKNSPGIEKARLLSLANASQAQLRALIDKGIVIVEKTDRYRDPYANIPQNTTPNVLSEEQTDAFNKIASLYRSGEAKAALLYGVTGSGKTRVIKAMIDEVLASGRTVIMLVPEISLTPQTVAIFCGYYGSRVAVIHSSLSEGERFDAWKRIRRGEVELVIGTRSAVFSPIPNLGMIVIDEEQEHTYKSDSAPRYHARDIARYRCGEEKALMLLASATPSIESFYRAKNGAYSLISLTERYGKAVLPEVKICDMREELRAGNTSPVSRELLYSLNEVKQNGKQAILLLNRRGYNNFVLCKSCGEVVKCSHCSVSMTFHRSNSGGYLMCHYCGNRIDPPKQCPSCQSPHINFVGCGTQKAETELKLLMPELKVLRMDADTTSTKHSYDDMLGSFRAGKADALLGTQMIAKGHDFPAVTLVGVISADTALNMDDYRAGERAFSLLTQVIGRAGRGEHPGKALIQTFSPSSEILKLVCTQDYNSFYEREIKLRETYVFPPFCDIAQFNLSSSEEKELFSAADALLKDLKELTEKSYSDVKYIAFGPFEAPVYKLNERYRLRLVLKCRQGKKTRELFSELLKTIGQNLGKKVTVSLDINPSSI
jgi:primosomal protein N' (replication factor Y)